VRIGKLFPGNRVVLDGEIVCLDKRGRSQFKNLRFHRGEPSFVTFDLLFDTVDWDFETPLAWLLNRTCQNPAASLCHAFPPLGNLQTYISALE